LGEVGKLLHDRDFDGFFDALQEAEKESRQAQALRQLTTEALDRLEEDREFALEDIRHLRKQVDMALNIVFSCPGMEITFNWD